MESQSVKFVIVTYFENSAFRQLHNRSNLRILFVDPDTDNSRFIGKMNRGKRVKTILLDVLNL